VETPRIPPPMTATRLVAGAEDMVSLSGEVRRADDADTAPVGRIWWEGQARA
jgi:hypothetical protein